MRNRKGFTLIELLIVVVIIGILAAIALPKFGQTRERAYESAMQSDLRNFQTAAEMFYNDNYNYPTGLGTGATEVAFTPSAAVNFVYAQVASPRGYTVVATHDGLPATRTCTLTVSQDPNVVEGIVCAGS
jgi:type IV pilus assembly protein PilA